MRLQRQVHAIITQLEKTVETLQSAKHLMGIEDDIEVLSNLNLAITELKKIEDYQIVKQEDQNIAIQNVTQRLYTTKSDVEWIVMAFGSENKCPIQKTLSTIIMELYKLMYNECENL
jgi:hypothetical protein